MKWVVVVASSLLAGSVNAGQLVCANPDSGAINVRSKCLKNESVLTLNNAGQFLAQTPTKVIPACRTVTASQATTTGAAAVSMTCNAGEFLLNYGDWTAPFVLTTARSHEVFYSGVIPIGVNISTSYDFGLPQSSSITNWTLNATATCCPRF